jgi:hypothetical protein
MARRWAVGAVPSLRAHVTQLMGRARRWWDGEGQLGHFARQAMWGWPCGAAGAAEPWSRARRGSSVFSREPAWLPALLLCSVPAKGTNPGTASGSAARFLSGGQTRGVISRRGTKRHRQRNGTSVSPARHFVGRVEANRGHVSGSTVSSELWYELRCSRTYFTIKCNFISISMSRLSRTLCPCLEFQLKTLYAYT